METCHSYPGCCFINLRMSYFTVKHSYLCNKKRLYTTTPHTLFLKKESNVSFMGRGRRFLNILGILASNVFIMFLILSYVDCMCALKDTSFDIWYTNSYSVKEKIVSPASCSFNISMCLTLINLANNVALSKFCRFHDLEAFLM